MAENLRGRVVARRDQNGNGNGEVEKTPQRTLAEQIEAKKEVFQQALPDGAEARHLIRDAISLVRVQPQLAKCDVNSVLGGLMTFAQLGLRPGVMGQGWLIPFKKRARVNGQWVDVWEAQIVIGYKGYAELIHRTDRVLSMTGRAVHKNDLFDLEYGIEERLTHKPAKGDRGEEVGYYSVIRYKGGGYVFWYMTVSECQAWRDKYAMARKAVYVNGEKTGEFEVVGPWRDNFSEMSIKTCFLRAQRWAPKSTELARATEVDGAVRKDMSIDKDEMFFAPHPDPYDGVVVDDEGTEDTPAGNEQPPPAEPASPPKPPAAKDDGRPVNDGQQRAMAAMLRKGSVTERDQRLAVQSALGGRTITTAKDLTHAEAGRIITALSNYQDAGTLTEELAKLTTPPPVADDTPAGPHLKPVPEDYESPWPPGTINPEDNPDEWHDAGHPRVVNGETKTVEIDEWCELCPNPTPKDGDTP